MMRPIRGTWRRGLDGAGRQLWPSSRRGPSWVFGGVFDPTRSSLDSSGCPPAGVVSRQADMDFALTASQQAIVDSVAQLCARFDLDYWRRRDRDGGFPHDFHAAIAQAGYLGVAMPAQHGGAGLGIT